MSLRTWSDETGRFQTQARFVDLQDGKVHLKLESGNVRIVPVEKLSGSDQEYVRDVQQQRQAERVLLAPGARKEDAPKAPWDAPSSAAAPEKPPVLATNWFSDPTISTQKTTEGLCQVWAMMPDAAGAQVAPLRAAMSSASPQGKLAIALLVAAANDRAGKPDVALGEYRQLAADGKDTSFGISASFRTVVLEGQDVKDKLSKLPAADGWFLVGNEWTWTSSRAAAGTVSITTPTSAVFSWWKAIGCFVMGVLWLGLCGLIGRICGSGCWGATFGVIMGCSALGSEGMAIATWHSGHQWAFGIGVAISLVLGLIAAANAPNTSS